MHSMANDFRRHGSAGSIIIRNLKARGPEEVGHFVADKQFWARVGHKPPSRGSVKS